MYKSLTETFVVDFQRYRTQFCNNLCRSCRGSSVRLKVVDRLPTSSPGEGVDGGGSRGDITSLRLLGEEM